MTSHSPVSPTSRSPIRSSIDRTRLVAGAAAPNFFSGFGLAIGSRAPLARVTTGRRGSRPRAGLTASLFASEDARHARVRYADAQAELAWADAESVSDKSNQLISSAAIVGNLQNADQ